MPVIQIMHLFFALLLLWFIFLKIGIEGKVSMGFVGFFWRVCLQLVVRETFSYQYLINYVNYRDEIHMYMYILTGWFSQQYHILFMQSIKTFFVHITCIFKNETVHYKDFASKSQSVIIIVELRLNKTSFNDQFNSMYLANKLIFTDRSQSQLRSKNAYIDWMYTFTKYVAENETFELFTSVRGPAIIRFSPE